MNENEFIFYKGCEKLVVFKIEDFGSPSDLSRKRSLTVYTVPILN